jgi:tetratricopeptide (TPR) repeat protein
MDCTHCEPVLLDLCYGELAPAQEREVRTHIADCPTCRKALSRLEAGQALARHLADEAPPPELTDRILRAARAHVRRSASPMERLQGFIEAMARLAMTRHFAMATLSVLIVVVGLWSVPELTRRREARPDTLVVEASQEEAGPSRAVAATSAPQPSVVAPEPVATVDKSARLGRTEDRARRKADEVASKRSERARTAASASSGPPAQRADRPQPRAADAPRRFAEPPPVEGSMAKAKGGAAPAKSAPPPPELDDLLEGSVGASDSLARQRDFAAEAERKVSKAEANPASDEAYAEREAAPAAAPASAAAATPAAPVALEDMFQAGVERYRAEDYAAAAQLFARMLESTAPSGQRASALLYLARSERALGRCDRAIRAYETLVRSYGSAQQSASALPEGVACHDQLGDSAGAIRLLEHATSVPTLAALASKALQDRGAGKSPDATSAPAKPAEAPSGARSKP